MRTAWRTRHALGLGLAIIASLGPDLARSQAPTPSTPPDSALTHAPAFVDSARVEVPRRMQDTVTVIRGVTVPGARVPATERSSATTTRLDRSAVVRFLPTTPADAMVTAPGVDLVKLGPWASRVSFRGFQGERVLVMVDGVRLNTGRGHGSNASLVSLDRLDEVELTAGSGGAAYGSDAVGGVINLVTHRPLFSDTPVLVATLSARGSMPGQDLGQSERLRYGSPRFGVELSGGVSRLHELVTPLEHVPNSGSRDGDFGARASIRLGAGTADFEHTRHAAKDVGLPALNGSFPLISRDADRLELETPFQASALGRALPAHARLLGVDQRYRTDLDETNITTVYGTSRRPIGYNVILDQDRIRTRSRGLQPELSLGSTGALRLGGEYRREDTSGPRTTTTGTTNGAGVPTDTTATEGESLPHARREVWAGSAASRLTLGRLQVETGARYDWLHSTARSRVAPDWSGLDVVDRRWSLDGGLAVRLGAIEPYGRIASGFRAPNLEERYYAGPVHGGMLVFGDSNLVAERNVTYEAGLRADADGWGTARVSAYRMFARDFITLRHLGLVYGQERFQYANLDRVQVDGLEFTGRGRLRGGSLTLSVTLPRGRDLVTGDRLVDIGVPRVSVDLSSPVGRWLPSGLVAFRARWSDAVREDPLRAEESASLARPAFWTFSTEFGVTAWGTRATFAVRNLLNNDYREPLSFVYEPGRTFSFALKREIRVPLAAARGIAP